MSQHWMKSFNPCGKPRHEEKKGGHDKPRHEKHWGREENRCDDWRPRNNHCK